MTTAYNPREFIAAAKIDTQTATPSPRERRPRPGRHTSAHGVGDNANRGQEKPVDYLLSVMRDDTVSFSRRKAAALVLLPYMHTRVKPLK